MIAYVILGALYSRASVISPQEISRAGRGFSLGGGGGGCQISGISLMVGIFVSRHSSMAWRSHRSYGVFFFVGVGAPLVEVGRAICRMGAMRVLVGRLELFGYLGAGGRQ